MENEIEEIRNRANKILSSYNMNVLSNEKKLLESLTKISNAEDIDVYYDTKTLNYIERYLIAKEKMQIAENDEEFLRNLSKELKQQEVRSTDIAVPPLFMIKNVVGNNVFFLTRKAVKNYLSIGSKTEKKIIEVPSSDSLEISQLLDIIKRNI